MSKKKGNDSRLWLRINKDMHDWLRLQSSLTGISICDLIRVKLLEWRDKYK